MDPASDISSSSLAEVEAADVDAASSDADPCCDSSNCSELHIDPGAGMDDESDGYGEEVCRGGAALAYLDDQSVADFVAYVMARPDVTAVRLCGDPMEQQLSIKSVVKLAKLLQEHPSLQDVALTNALLAGEDLSDVRDLAMTLLGRGFARARRLRRLSLQSNTLSDRDVYHLVGVSGEGLLLCPLLEDLDFSDNYVTLQGLSYLRLLAEHNRSVCNISLMRTAYPGCVTDTWDGFQIRELCSINRTLLHMGPHRRGSHMAWPPSFRRAVRAFWRAFGKVARLYGVEESQWDFVFSIVDLRPFVTMRTRLWMKQQDPERSMRASVERLC
eukprot:TRINITY_DN2720_c0_g4_i1.p1 TRINITY_DN2720_c0_g4~~TRINITY_DN2720_c0_g4_i1.p1  ORF type:complete len:329 (+),score=104.51 TRINITY_DN2720_c0_g4_i1:54-1040(+)